MFQGFYPQPHQGSAIDLGEITDQKTCDNKIYVIFYFNYLMMLGAGRNSKLRKISKNKGPEQPFQIRLFLNNVFLFKIFCIFFSVNEQLTAIFQSSQGYVLYQLSLFLLFALDYLSEHSHIYTGLILLITQNIPRYLLLAFCLFV